MFFAVQITDSWLVSARAKRVYSVAALFVALFLGLIVATALVGGSLQVARVADVIFSLLFLPAIVGTAMLNVAMWYFWVRCHSNDSRSKGIWMFVMWTSSPLGALIYFFFFYLRSPLVRRSPRQQAATV